MTKIFALLAILLIASGTLLMAVPREEPSQGRSLAPDAIVVPSLITQVRNIAEQVNAPLSIVFGLVSLFYTRRTYLATRDRVGGAGAQR